MDDLYLLVSNQETDRAVDHLIDRIDDLCLDGAFDLVEDLVRRMDKTRLCPTTLCCLASVLFPARRDLDYPSLFSDLKLTLTNMVGSARCERILSGFDPEG